MDYIEVLKRLISIDTTVPPGANYEAAIDYLQPLFKNVGLETQKVPVPPEHAEGQPGRVALVGHGKKTGKPSLVLYGHVDVVPAEGWDAFKPRVEKGKIYGRGAADMKGSIAALLEALDSVRDKQLNYDISVMITTDEEIGQAGQLRYLTSFLKPQPGAYYLNLDSSAGYVSVAVLGLLQLDILVKGKSVHSGLSHMGINAVENAVPFMQALLELKERVTRKKSKVDVEPGIGLKKMIPRLNINMISGGLKANIVPDRCVISIDRRLIPEETVEEARAELMKTLSSVRGIDWEIIRDHFIPTVPASEGPIVDEFARIVKEVTGQTGKFGGMGSGDLPHIVAEWGGEVFGIGCSRPECNVHGKNEFVNEKDLKDLVQVLVRFMTT